jgi:hypothetical protein
MIDAGRRLVVVVDHGRRAGQRPERHGEGLPSDGECRGFVRRGLRGRKELEQRLHLRTAAGGRLQSLTPRLGRRAVEREARSELPVRPALHRPEEEGAVSQDRAADGPAELPFFPERRFGRREAVDQDALVEIVHRVQAVVVDVREGGAFERVRPVAGDHVHDGSGGAPEFRRELIRDQPELLNGIGVIELLLPAGDTRIVAVLAVDHEVVRAQSHAVRREVRPGRELGLAAAKLTHPRRGQRDGKDVAAVHHRQLRDAGRVESHADLGVGRVEQRRVGPDLDVLRHPGRLNLHVHDGVLVEREREPRPDVLRESGELRRQLVLADRDVQKAVAAVGVGHDGPARIRLGVADGHGRTRDDRVLLVFDRTLDASSGRLRPQRARGREDDEETHERKTPTRTLHPVPPWWDSTTWNKGTSKPSVVLISAIF